MPICRRDIAGLLVAGAIGATPPALGAEDAAGRVGALEDEVSRLEARLLRMERLVERLTLALEAGARGGGAAETATGPALDQLYELDLPDIEDLGAPIADAGPAGAERADAAAAPADEPAVDIGGALRFNAFFRDFAKGSDTKRGESGLDLFRLGVEGEYRNLLVSAEYRWYPYMDTLHHGWVGYAFDGGDQVQVGVHKVPFGILPYASHNYWFGIPYYLGLADDYDLGVKYLRERGPWNAQLAFYKSEEQGDPTSLDRYGFDLVRVGGQQNEETNRINVRLARTFGDAGCSHEVGLSGQRGQLYNAVIDDNGRTWAAAAHLDSRCGRWNLQLQAARYDYDPELPPGVSGDTVRLGAFAGSYDIASRGELYVANLAYNFDVPWPWLDQITCYNDYSRLEKPGGAEPSQLNTTGCAVGAGSLFTYLDLIQAYNMPYFEDGSLADGGNDEWQTRLNLNVGYYW